MALRHHNNDLGVSAKATVVSHLHDQHHSNKTLQLNYRLNLHPPRLKSSILLFKQLCFPSSRALQPTYYITSQICF